MHHRSFAWPISSFLLLGSVACKPRTYSDQGNTSSTPGETAAQTAAAVEDAIAAERLLGDPRRSAEANFDQAGGRPLIAPEALAAERVNSLGRALLAHELAVSYLRERGFRPVPTALIQNSVVFQPSGSNTGYEKLSSDVTFKIGFQPASGSAPLVFDFQLREVNFTGLQEPAEVKAEIIRFVGKMIERVERRLVHVVSIPAQSDVIPSGDVKTKFLAAASRLTAAEMAEMAVAQTTGTLPTNWYEGNGGGGELGAEFTRAVPKGSALFERLRIEGRQAKFAADDRIAMREPNDGRTMPQQALIDRLEVIRKEFGDKNPTEVATIKPPYRHRAPHVGTALTRGTSLRLAEARASSKMARKRIVDESYGTRLVDLLAPLGQLFSMQATQLFRSRKYEFHSGRDGIAVCIPSGGIDRRAAASRRS